MNQQAEVDYDPASWSLARGRRHPIVSFVDMNRMLRHITNHPFRNPHRTIDLAVTYTGVDQDTLDTFLRLTLYNETEPLYFYHSVRRELTLKGEGRDHHLFKDDFIRLLQCKIAQMDLQGDVSCHHFYRKQCEIDGVGMVIQPSAALMPVREEREGHDSWPTVVLDIGSPQPMDKLLKRAMWWLEKSDHRVKVVIAVSISANLRTMDIAIVRISNPGDPGYVAMNGGDHSRPDAAHLHIQDISIALAPFEAERPELYAATTWRAMDMARSREASPLKLPVAKIIPTPPGRAIDSRDLTIFPTEMCNLVADIWGIDD